MGMYKRIYLSFQFQMNKKERVICAFKMILRNLSICCCSNPNDDIICAYVNIYVTFCLAINYRNSGEPFIRKPLAAL